jgi:RND superfamily putative drug exporter
VESISPWARRDLVEGSGLKAIGIVILACLVIVIPPVLALVLLNWILRRLSGRRIPSLIVGPLDRAIFTPYEVRRHRLEHTADATHGFWKRVGDRVARSPAGHARLDRRAAVFCAGFAFFSTELTSEDSYRNEVESVEGQHLLDKSFPSGTTAPTDIVVENPATSRGDAAVEASTASRRSRGRSPKGRPGT